MENCCYEEICEEIIISKEKRSPKFSWKPLLHQTFICSGIWTCYFMFGMSMGAPTVFIPQIRREANSTDAISIEMASWLNAILALGGLPWVIVLPILARHFGRVLPYRLLSVISVAAIIVAYFSTNVVHILISELMQGITGAALMSLFLIIITETTSPQYRGVFLTIKSASFYWGIWVSNAIGTFFYWKNICIIQFVCAIYICISTLLLPESPYWLASKGRTQECIASYRWLQGHTESADKELESMLTAQKSEQCTMNQKTEERKFRKFLKFIIRKEFFKPILFSALLINLYYSTGKMVCTMYAIDILKKISSNESVAYTVMLVLDGITVLSMYIGCGLSKICKRKSLLLGSTSVGITFLFIMSIYLYSIKFSIILENKYATACLLMCYSIGISCGPMILISSICSELLPLKFRSSVACIIALYDRTILGIYLKISPALFLAFGTHGTFLFFGIISSFFLIIIHKYIPETKDKRLEEIVCLMNNDNNTDTSLIDRKNVIVNYINNSGN